MGKAIRLTVVIVLLAAALLAVVSFTLNAYLNSAQFRSWVQAKTSATLGVPVQVEDFRFSLWKGFVLKGLAVPSAPAFKDKPFFAAKSFEFRYRLASLLTGRIDIAKVVLDTPALTLYQDAQGRTNIPGAQPAPAAAASPAPSTALPLDVQIEQLALTDGAASVYRADGTATALVEGADVASRIHLSGDDADLDGDFSVKQITLPGLLEIDDLRSPFSLKNKQFSLSHIQGSTFGGALDGEGSLDLTKTSTLPFALNLKGSNIDLQRLVSGLAGSSSPVSGKVQAQINAVVPLTSTLDLTGMGHTEITDCKLPSNPVFQLLGTTLNIPELAGGSFQLASSDFSLGNRTVTLSQLLLQGPLVKITGGGKVGFDQTYDLQLQLTLASSAVRNLPQQARGALKQNSDGTFQTPAFRVYGKPGAMQADLLQQLLKQGVGNVIQQKAGGVLKKFGF